MYDGELCVCIGGGGKDSNIATRSIHVAAVLRVEMGRGGVEEEREGERDFALLREGGIVIW